MRIREREVIRRAEAFSKLIFTADSLSSKNRFIEEFLYIFGCRLENENYIYNHNYLWSKEIMILIVECNTINIDKAIEYAKGIGVNIPNYILISDFNDILLLTRNSEFDTNYNRRIKFKISELPLYLDWFNNLDKENKYWTTSEKENEANTQAATLLFNLHYRLRTSGFSGNKLEALLIRLLYCMFAQDTGIMTKNSFTNYIKNTNPDASNLSESLVDLFGVLNTSEENRNERQKTLSLQMGTLPYIGGDIFTEEEKFHDSNMKFTIGLRGDLVEALKFDWSYIQPAIFGSMYQNILNSIDSDYRRDTGAHYTTEDNILKVINPLFLDELYALLSKYEDNLEQLNILHDRLSTITLLDPACGCGNFLLVAYKELRVLEIEIIKAKMRLKGINQIPFDEVDNWLKVRVSQFYGIEINSNACHITRITMWLADHLSNCDVTRELKLDKCYKRLPVDKGLPCIHHGNSMQVNWEDIVAKHKLSYIIGNPPFKGYSTKSDDQRYDVETVFLDKNGRPDKTSGRVDYSALWLYKAAKMGVGTDIRSAFVITSSVVQGEQVSTIWKLLYDMFGIHIDFAWRSFVWENGTKGNAAVHCVIIGFSSCENNRDKVIYSAKGKTIANNINAYLMDAPNIFIERHATPLCNIPRMIVGNFPRDGGNLLLEEYEYKELINKEPEASKWIKPLLTSDGFINNKRRYCLWLLDSTEEDIKRLPEVSKRVQRCKQLRLESTRDMTYKLAATPHLMDGKINPESFIAIPGVSSERRKYIPMGFMNSDWIPCAPVQIIPDANLYHFGILTSSVHMIWMRAIGGRLKSDYSYSNSIVYNNFPWMEITPEQEEEIATLAKSVLSSREPYLNAGKTLAYLYDPNTMPNELRDAHNKLDEAVLKLYEFRHNTSDEEVLSRLMSWYMELISGGVDTKSESSVTSADNKSETRKKLESLLGGLN